MTGGVKVSVRRAAGKRRYWLWRALTEALTAPVPGRPGVPVARIWARATTDPAAGPEANLWAGTPEDVAALLVPVVEALTARAAAEALREAADEADASVYKKFTRTTVAEVLRARAAALEERAAAAESRGAGDGCSSGDSTL